MNIAFLTSGHLPFDDRIFYHMARSLHRNNHNVSIISSKIELTQKSGGISLNCFDGDNLSKKDKINQFIARLPEFQPELIICSEPLTVLAARRFSNKEKRDVRIIYDITEWYPSGKNLYNFKIPGKIYHFIRLLLFNIYASRLTDGFIFGEFFKSRPYRLLFPFKPFTFVHYYPDLKYIPYINPDHPKGRLTLMYSGKISSVKGYGNFLSTLGTLHQKLSSLKIEVKIIGWYETPADKNEFGQTLSMSEENISIKIYARQDFENYLELIKDCDIFIDLRTRDFENNRSLPIKLFYFAALGRPVIYSDLKAIRREVETGSFGFLVNPANSDEIADIIIEYLNNPELYYKHCSNSRNLATDKYNWALTEPEFLRFLRCR